MVEISMSGSGEGPVWVTGRGYSTVKTRDCNVSRLASDMEIGIFPGFP
jgi:hypothetical protein